MFYISSNCYCPAYCDISAVLRMGLLMSSMTKGGAANMFSYAMGAVYGEFIKENDTSFEQFHAKMLDVFTTFNAAMPGRHYDTPRLEEVKGFYYEWKEEAKSDEERKEKFISFMNEYVKPSHAHPATLFAGIVTPPAALAAKKAGESLPQLKMIKHVPDVLFVPTATVIALMSVKMSRRMFMTTLATTTTTTTTTSKP